MLVECHTAARAKLWVNHFLVLLSVGLLARILGWQRSALILLPLVFAVVNQPVLITILSGQVNLL